MLSLKYTQKHPLRGVFVFEFFVLPTSYFPSIASIIAAHGLNFSVRNGKRCDPRAKSGEQKIQSSIWWSWVDCNHLKRSLWEHSALISQAQPHHIPFDLFLYRYYTTQNLLSSISTTYIFSRLTARMCK
jgi:hypothetical protein